MEQPVTIDFVFQTIGVIVAITAIGVILVRYKSKK
jgi:hypothetical protein